MIELSDVVRVLQDRATWGTGYRNMNLESKRRSAILWLRNCSRKGWIAEIRVKRK
jgi:hypothetical protein